MPFEKGVAPPRGPRKANPGAPKKLVEEWINTSEMPEHVASTYRKAMAGNTPRLAIKAFCLECQGFERRAVAECGAQHCPLWRFRPYRTMNKAAGIDDLAPGQAEVAGEAGS